MASCTSTAQDVTTTGNTITSDAAESSGAHFVDVEDLVCADGSCPLVVGGLVTYHDEGHITRSWSKILAAELERRLGLAVRHHAARTRGKHVQRPTTTSHAATS
jgi:hypothetical protein